MFFLIILSVVLTIISYYLYSIQNRVRKNLSNLKIKHTQSLQINTDLKNEILHLCETLETEKDSYKNKFDQFNAEINQLKTINKQAIIQRSLEVKEPETISPQIQQNMKEKELKIKKLEERVAVLKNKNFYKVSLEKAEVMIEELQSKVRILERNLESKRTEVMTLKNKLKNISK